MKESGISLFDGKKTSECIWWCWCGVIDEDNLLDAFTNYKFEISLTYQHHIVSSDILASRNNTNAILKCVNDKIKSKEEEERKKKE